VNDLRRATQLLAAGGDSCVLCRGEDTLVSGARGVAPLVDWIAAGVDLRGYSAADRVVGRAAALLYALAGVVAVHANLASQPALAVCAAHGIRAEADTTVPGILNRDRTGPCPMEAAVAGTDQPEIAADRLQAALRARRGQ
jgi:hypothetical protein